MRAIINVSGTSFTTTSETLEKAKFFANGIPSFIDRNPRSFEIILSYLQGYGFEKPSDPYLLNLVCKDAEFYGIEQLSKLVEVPHHDRELSLEQITKEAQKLLFELHTARQYGIWNGPEFSIKECDTWMKIWRIVKEMRKEFTKIKTRQSCVSDMEAIKAAVKVTSGIVCLHLELNGSVPKASQILKPALNTILNTEWENEQKNRLFTLKESAVSDENFFVKERKVWEEPDNILALKMTIFRVLSTVVTASFLETPSGRAFFGTQTPTHDCNCE